MVGVILTVLGTIIITEIVTATTFFIIDASFVRRGIPTTDEQVETITTFAQKKLEGSTDSTSLLLAGTVAIIGIPIILASLRSRARAIKQIKETGERKELRLGVRKLLTAIEARKVPIIKKGVGVGIPTAKVFPELDITGRLIHVPGLGVQNDSGDKVFVATHPKIQTAIDMYPELLAGIPDRLMFVQPRNRRIFLPPDIEEEEA